MKSITNLLSSLVSKQHTPFVQKLNSCSIMQNNPIILMTDILYLIECFEGFGPECNGIYLTGQEYLQQFFKAITNKPMNGFIAIKITLTIHLILYEFQIGDSIADEMVKEGSSLRIQENQQFSNFVQNYLMYLLKLAQNLKLFYACKIGQYPIFDQDQTYTQCSENTRDQQFQQFQILKKNNNFRDTNLQYRNYQQKKLELHMQQQTGCITIEQKILYLFKLHNLLNQCIQILNICINTLKQLENQDCKNIFIEISCVLWNDCMVMYKFATQELCKLLDSFRFMPLQQLLSIQQIYWVTINSSTQIKYLYNNRKYFDQQNIVKQPFWFEENKKLSQEIQNSIIDNKMLQIPDSTRNVNKVSTPQACQNQKSPTNIAQPFTSRIGNSQNSTKTTIPLQPYFIANKKLSQQPQQFETQQPMSTRAKNFVGSIFSDEQLTLSPRESTKQQQQ
ncbi:unnamed protein product (macronuclear) [Paramecium tetraurelia]|uniref:AP180 N-terminal homology (ANTH) domain-containing protein n=1 Tax=Paramecium tetraurelia TaxID=5888 RepID=A0BX39_PARTE|nr:uncharacterized protein GSPATT00032958001 [Paramecium tetraurelia]CAK63106.1 unnamed protein product [Paramecium tetraurelia]|eukprot:XP_001430504.1 hypothetical protein (macronuclear) [Paramecium tetraurelia strain d4-2]